MPCSNPTRVMCIIIFIEKVYRSFTNGNISIFFNQRFCNICMFMHQRYNQRARSVLYNRSSNYQQIQRSINVRKQTFSSPDRHLPNVSILIRFLNFHFRNIQTISTYLGKLCDFDSSLSAVIPKCCIFQVANQIAALKIRLFGLANAFEWPGYKNQRKIDRSFFFLPPRW